MEYNIRNMIIGGKMVTFTHYKQNELWYTTECGFEFPVPISDTSNAAFLNTDRAILFMRWINSHIKNIEEGNLTT